MDGLITLSNGVALLDPTTADRIEDFERTIKEIKEKEDELKQMILAEMEEKNILTIKTETMTISYVAPTDRETLDSKRLKAEKPDLYDEYVKMSPVKANVRIRLS
ncbi:MAG: hypothetical protein J6U74_01995 [Clostridia bacterium]|nr:hypothetical protein [Clostridia bacterium]